MSGELLEPPRRRARFPAPPRLLLLVLVLAGTVWAFKAHFENVIRGIEAGSTVSDETGSLPEDKVKLLTDAAQALKAAYGVNLVIRVSKGEAIPPPATADTLFIGLDTSASTATVVLPPLLAKALDPGLAARLQSGYFDAYFAAGTWPEGLYSCVLTILEGLDDKR